MRNFILLAVLAITLTSCQRKPRPLSAKEKMLCGRWMVHDQQYNRERFVFKPDRGFQDILFSGNVVHDPRTAEAWKITGDQLSLKFKMRLFIVPVHYTLHYHIDTLNDSVLVIASKATRRFASRTISLKKMKLNGKFIGG